MSDCAAELAETVRDAYAQWQPLRAAGSGSYARWFAPDAHGPGLSQDRPQEHSQERPQEQPPMGEQSQQQARAPVQEVSTRRHSGIIDFDPANMVLSARSGTRLAEVESLLAESSMQLGAEVPRLSPEATIGGAVAMGFSGPATPFRGALRDFVLGARIINGRGQILQFGGRTLRNTAGFDIARLMTGSRGRLGLILDISLQALPRTERAVTLALPDQSYREAMQFADELWRAAEPLSGVSYYRSCLYLRFGGRERAVQRLRHSLGGELSANDWWDDLRDWKFPWGETGHMSFRRERFREPHARDEWLADRCGALVWSSRPEPTALHSYALGGHRGAPPGMRSDIERRVVAAFDPRGVFMRENA